MIRTIVIVSMAIAAAFGAAIPAPAMEIYGSVGPTYTPTPEEARRAIFLNEARMRSDLAACKAGTMIGTQCHGYCRDESYGLGPRWCDAYGNFRDRR